MFWNVSARAGRLGRIAALGLFSLSLVPGGATAAERPLDFGAALLMPADADDAGFGDLGIVDGRYMSLAQMIMETTGDDTIPAELEDLDIEGIHNLILHPAGGVDGEPGSDVSIVSTITVYGDEDAAEDGYAYVEDESADEDATDLENPPVLGDESELTEWVLEDDEENMGFDLHRLEISFRTGPIVASVVVSGFDSELDRDEVEALGERLEAKITDVLENGRIDGERTPGLDSIAPRYESDEVLQTKSHYCVLNGEALLDAYDPERQEPLQQLVDIYDIDADYCSGSRLLLSADGDAYVSMNVQATRIVSTDEAERFVVDEEEWATGPDSGYDDVEVIDLDADDLPFEADLVLAMTFQRNINGEMMYVTQLMAQQGKLVIDVRISGYSAPDVDVLIAVMADALGCADSACYQTLDAPEELLDFIAEQVEEVESR